MAEEKIPGSPVPRWAPVLVLVLAVAVVGLYYIAGSSRSIRFPDITNQPAIEMVD